MHCFCHDMPGAVKWIWHGMCFFTGMIMMICYILFTASCYLWMCNKEFKVPKAIDILFLPRKAKFVLKSFMTINIRNPNHQKIELNISYKFYNELFYNLIHLNKKYGSPIQKAFSELKKALSRDFCFEKKLQSLFLGGLFQMFIIAFIGICFNFVMCLQLERKFVLTHHLYSFIWQCIGLSLYMFFNLKLRQKFFFHFELSIQKLYLLRAYILAQLPLSESLKKIKLDELNGKEGNVMIERLALFIQGVKSSGHLDMKDIELCIEENWQHIEIQSEKFTKYQAGIRLFIILFFFLSTYLYSFYTLFDQMTP